VVKKPSGEIRAKDASTGGEKGRKPAQFALLPWDALWAVAEHYGRGAKKYSPRNWERGYPWSWSFDALQRHLAAYWQGEDMDEDGQPHLAAAAFHVLAMLAFSLRKAGTDDRPFCARRRIARLCRARRGGAGRGIARLGP
jgi:hypothetical protein